MQRIDSDNINWFTHDGTRNSLLKITISGCNLRGIFPSSIEFKYPITAIAGCNGSGKSTLLALAACAFHNDSSFCPQSKTNPKGYYTYSDFFVFTGEEHGLTRNITIKSEYLGQGTNGNATTLSDVRRKKPSGKWNDYNTRPRRVVSFMGINRILPPSESPTHKNFRKQFTTQQLSPEQINILKDKMTTIFGRSYSDVSLAIHNRYKLFSVERADKYSGFNMGAGENAVLSLLYEIITAGDGALFVIDEIELGLHVSAQQKLICVLKELSKKYKSQIICSTHSEYILKSLPACGRILVKSTHGSTVFLPDITPECALRELSNTVIPELTVFVEDEKAKYIVSRMLKQQNRHRVSIMSIGSADNSIPGQMIARYREHQNMFCAILDGDKRSKKITLVNKIVAALADRDDMSEEEKKSLFDGRISFLPGDSHPEKVIIENLLTNTNIVQFFPSWDATEESIREAFTQAIASGTHNEFYTLSQSFALEESSVFNEVVNKYVELNIDECENINNFICQHLPK